MNDLLTAIRLAFPVGAMIPRRREEAEVVAWRIVGERPSITTARNARKCFQNIGLYPKSALGSSIDSIRSVWACRPPPRNPCVVTAACQRRRSMWAICR